MNIRKLIAIILLVTSVVLAIVSGIVLPETVITQISTSGSDPSTMPKWVAIILPTVLGIGFAVAAFMEKAERKTTAKYIFISAVGVFVFIVELIVNC